VAFKSMISARKDGKGHAAYVIARNAIEVIEAKGGVFEFLHDTNDDGNECDDGNSVAPTRSSSSSSSVRINSGVDSGGFGNNDVLRIENDRLRRQVMKLRGTLRQERADAMALAAEKEMLRQEVDRLREQAAVRDTEMRMMRTGGSSYHAARRTHSPAGARPVVLLEEEPRRTYSEPVGGRHVDTRRSSGVGRGGSSEDGSHKGRRRSGGGRGGVGPSRLSSGASTASSSSAGSSGK
jgi:hypothetical protein